MKPEQPIPYGSKIEFRDLQYGRRYVWPESKQDFMQRFFAVVFLSVWLLFWTLGGWHIFRALVLQGPAPPSIYFWFCLWALALLLTLRTFWLLTFARRRPESITLEGRDFIYDPGSVPLNEVAALERKNWLDFLCQSRKPVRVDKEQLAFAFLTQGKNRKRLYLVDSGNESYEIARYVRDEDREWLAELINSWLAEPDSATDAV